MLAVILAASSATASVAPGMNESVSRAVVSYSPLPETGSAGQLETIQLASIPLEDVDDSSRVVGSVEGGADSVPLPSEVTTAAAGVPSGYKRPPGTRVDDYRYRTVNMYFGNYHCVNSECKLQSQVEAQWYQTLNGGSSKYWYMKAVARTFKASALTWRMTFGYSCGVNVTASPDHLCEHDASSSGASGSLASAQEI